MGGRERRIKEAKKGGKNIRKEEVKLPLITDNMILHIENHKGITKKTVKTNKQDSKVLGYKSNIQKSMVFFY